MTKPDAAVGQRWSRPPVLLVGSSVRYLAESGDRIGIPVVGVDGFGDVDMRTACRMSRRAAAPDGHSLAEAVAGLGLESSMAWSYGAGFEAVPAALAMVAGGRLNLLGNAPSVLALLADPRRWFATLEELTIDFPPVCYTASAQPAGWLLKRAGSCGGRDVTRYEGGALDTDRSYLQREIDGQLLSLVFAADGKRVFPIGYNELFAHDSAQGDFLFSAAVGGIDPDFSTRARMLRVADLLTERLGLRGVNGLDFVLHDGNPLLLDLNARPPATLELYEFALRGGGLHCHMEACQGRLPRGLGGQVAHGIEIVYAERAMRIAELEWPRWVSDRPAFGELIEARAPLCTVHANGATRAAIKELLAQRRTAVNALVEDFYLEVA